MADKQDTLGAKKIIKSWSNGKLVRGRRRLDSLNVGLNYAQAVWEGMRSFKQIDGTTKIFQLEDHIYRLFKSAKVQGIRIPYDVKDIINGCNILVNACGGGDLYIRPIAYIDSDCSEIRQDFKVSVDIHAFEMTSITVDVKAIISSHSRSYPEYDMQSKCSANYNKIFKMFEEAERANADVVLVTDKNGYIVEAIAANIFIQKGDVIITPPDNGSILPGITRRTVVEILQDPLLFAKHQKTCMVAVKELTKADLYTADGIFLTNTRDGIVNVSEVDGKKIGLGKDNFYYKYIKNTYSNLIRGKK